MQDTDWERIDKSKFFFNGLGLFSGVTTLLFPLSVIKTRQMSSHGIPGGFAGTKLTAQTIWRTEGVPGFYRGFATVVFGTIPARTIYLTSLEVVKDATAKVGRQLELSETTIATGSNFVGGACASLSTQLVTVPIDVVSQRQMVHGTDTHSKPKGEAGGSSSRHGHGGASPSSTGSSPASTAAGSSSSAPGSQGSRQFSTQAAVGGGDASRACSQQQARAMSHAAAGPHSPHLEPRSRARHQHQHMPRTVGQQPVMSPRWLSSGSSAGSSAATGGTGVLPARLGGLQVARMIVREEGVMGLYRGFLPSLAAFVPNSALWWGAYGGYQSLLSLAYVNLRSSESAYPHGTASMSVSEVMGCQTLASMCAGLTTGLLTNPLDLIKTRIQVARKSEGQPATFRAVLEEILREDGAGGLLRGALPRMANSALWGTCMVTVYEFLKRISIRGDLAAA